MYQNYLSGRKFPALKVLVVSEGNDRTFMIMEWVAGATLLSKLRFFSPRRIKFLKEMAQLQTGLHKIPHKQLRKSLESNQLVIKSLSSEVKSLDDKISEDTCDSIVRGTERIKTNQLTKLLADNFCICHGDLNVFR